MNTIIEKEEVWEKGETLGYIVKFANSRYGIMNLDGKVISQEEYDDLIDRGQSTLEAVKNHKKGVMNIQGKVIVPCIFERIGNSSEDINIKVAREYYAKGNPSSFLTSSVKYGLYDYNGNMLCPPVYDDVKTTSSGYIVREDASYSLIGKTGKKIISGCTMICEICSSNYYLIRRGNSVQIMNGDGIICSMEFTELCCFSYLFNMPIGLAPGGQGKWAVIRADGEILTDYKYDIDRTIKLPWARKDNRYGLIDQNGIEKTDFIFSTPTPFRPDNLSICSVGENHYGVINTKGEIIIPFIYESIEDLFYIENDGKSHDVGFIVQKNKWGVLSRKGDVVVEIEYDQLKADEFLQIIRASTNGYSGLLKFDGTVICPFVYDSIDFYIDDDYNVKWVAKSNDEEYTIDIDYDSLTIVDISPNSLP